MVEGTMLKWIKKTSLEGGTIVKERRKRRNNGDRRFKTLADTFKNRNQKKKKMIQKEKSLMNLFPQDVYIYI